MIRDKILAKLLETLVIKALKQEGKEPTTENIEAFIDDALKEIEEENKDCETCKYSCGGNVSVSSKCIKCDSHYSKYEKEIEAKDDGIIRDCGEENE